MPDADRLNRIAAYTDTIPDDPLAPIVRELLEAFAGADQHTADTLRRDLDRLRTEHSRVLEAHQVLEALHAATVTELEGMRPSFGQMVADRDEAIRQALIQESVAVEARDALHPYQIERDNLLAVVESLHAQKAVLAEDNERLRGERDRLVDMIPTPELRHGRGDPHRPVDA